MDRSGRRRLIVTGDVDDSVVGLPRCQPLLVERAETGVRQVDCGPQKQEQYYGPSDETVLDDPHRNSTIARRPAAPVILDSTAQP